MTILDVKVWDLCWLGPIATVVWMVMGMRNKVDRIQEQLKERTMSMTQMHLTEDTIKMIAKSAMPVMDPNSTWCVQANENRVVVMGALLSRGYDLYGKVINDESSMKVEILRSAIKKLENEIGTIVGDKLEKVGEPA